MAEGDVGGEPRADFFQIMRSIEAGSVLASLLLAFAVLGTAWNIYASDRSAALVARNHALSDRAEAVLSSMKDLETGERGFLLTGKPQYLEPYHAATSQLQELLRDDVADTDPERTRIATLQALVKAKRAVAERAIQARRDGMEAAAFLDADGDKATMDAIRSEVATQRQDLGARAGAEERRSRNRSLILTILAALAGVIACGWFAWLAVSHRKKEKATNALLEASSTTLRSVSASSIARCASATSTGRSPR